MAFTKNETKKNNRQHDITITNAKDYGDKVKFSMKVNGVFVSSCWLRQYEKDGLEKFIISFPGEKYTDKVSGEVKYYNYVLVPMDETETNRVAELVLMALQEIK